MAELSAKELAEIREQVAAKRRARELAAQGMAPMGVGSFMAPRGPENPEEVGQMVGEIGGSLLGGPAGGRFLGPLLGKVAGPLAGKVAGRLAGAGAGAAAGQALAGGEDPAGAALRGTAGEGIGLGAARGLQGLASGLGRVPGFRPSPSALPFAREADLAMGGGGQGVFAGEGGLGVGQAIDSAVMRTLTTVADTTVVGESALGAQARRAGQQAADLSQRFVDNLIQSDPSKVVRGEVIDQAIRDGSDAFHQLARARYGALDSLTKNAAVDLTRLKDLAAREGERVGGMEGARGQVIRNILSLDDQVPFAKAQELRSYLMGVGRTTDPNPKAAQTAAQYLTKHADQAMEAGAQAAGPRVLSAWRATNDWYKQGVGRFNNDIIRRVLRRDPESIVDNIIAGGGKPETVQRVLDAAGPEHRTVLRDHFLARVLKESSSPEQLFAPQGQTGAVTGQDFLKRLAKYDRETLELLFNPNEMKGIRTMAAALERGQRGATGAEGPQRLLGTWGFYLSQVAGAGGAATGLVLGDPKAVAGGTLLLLSPKALGWFLTNPQTRRWLIHGASIPPGTVSASRVTGNLLSQARRAQRMFGSEEVQIQEGGAQPVPPPSPTGRFNPIEGPMSFMPNDLSALREGR